MRGGRCIGIAEGFDIRLSVFIKGHNAQLIIVASVPMMTARVPALQFFAGQPRQDQAPACVDTVDPDGLAREAKDVAKIWSGQPRIPLLDQLPGSVMDVSGDE